ncbi:MAG: apolipoprotein N-acyltransferase [Gammaproteobacteria bacterium]|nr:apolipoprotein N-acyltransferase [Gammaproteobacteria bacterium]
MRNQYCHSNSHHSSISQIPNRPWVAEWTEVLQRRPIGAKLIALVAGASLVLVFAPYGWWPLSLAAPAVLLFLWLDCSARQSFWRGYAFGLGLFSLSVSWVYNSIYEFGHAPPLLAFSITLLFILFLSLYPALTGLLAHRLRCLPLAVRLTLVYPLIWMLLEWLRGWVLTGFPWLLLGQAHVDTPLAGIIPVFGVLAASGLNMLLAGLIVLSFATAGRTRVISVVLIVSITLVAQFLTYIDWTQPTGSSIKVSLIQANIPQDIKWQPERFQPTLDLYRNLSRAHWSSDIIIWPETAVPAYYHQVEESFLTPLAEEAQAHGSELLVGIFVRGKGQGRTYNSIIKPGLSPQFYHKRHLVPFGEYFPFRGVLAWMADLIVIPMSDLETGRDLPIVQLQDYKVGVSICYEDAYGNEVIDALPEADLLVNISNDAWFGDSLAPHQHLEIARLRALEAGRYLLRSTNTGISAVIDPKGGIVARSPQFRADVLTAKIVAHGGLTPYARWGNWALLVIIFVVLIVFTLMARVSRIAVKG